jgi:hypothetical protein
MLIIKSKIYMRELANRLVSNEDGVVGEIFLIVAMVLLVVVILSAIVPGIKSFVTNSLSTAENTITSMFNNL